MRNSCIYFAAVDAGFLDVALDYRPSLELAVRLSLEANCDPTIFLQLGTLVADIK